MNGSSARASWVYEVWGEYPAIAQTTIHFGHDGVELQGPFDRDFVIDAAEIEKVIKVSEARPGSWSSLLNGILVMGDDYHLVFHINGHPHNKIVIGKNYVPHFRAYLREHGKGMVVAEATFECASSADPIKVTIHKDYVHITETDPFHKWGFNLTYGEAAQLVEELMTSNEDEKLGFVEAFGYIDDDGDIAFIDHTEIDSLFIESTEIPGFLQLLETYCTTTVDVKRGPQWDTMPQIETDGFGASYVDWEGTRYYGGDVSDFRFCTGWGDHDLQGGIKCVRCGTRVIKHDHIPGASKLDIENPKDAIGQTKLDLGEFPTVALVEGALAMEQGALKYGKRNFRYADVKASVYIAALKRHIHKYESGEDFDVDTDGVVHHLGAVEACAAILLDASAHGTLIDDREFSTEEAEYIDEAQERVQALREKFGSDKRLLEDRK